MDRNVKLIILGLVVLGFALYAFNVNDALFWDDDDWIINNPAVHALSWENLKFLFSHDILAGIGQSSNYYRPLLMFSFALNWAISGPSGWSYHLVSNLLHIASAVLIFLLLSRLLRHSSLDIGHSRIAAALAALFWLVHPLQTEAVTYVSGRGDPLSVFFMLLAVHFFIRVPNFAIRHSYFLLALLFALLGILSRETAVLFPGYLVLILMTFRYGALPFFRSLALSLRNVWPCIALSAAYLVARLTFLSFGNLLNWHRTVNVYSESVLVRTWTFFGALWDYLRLTIFPVGLHMERTVPVLTSPFQWPVPLVLTILVIGIWFLVFSWRKGNRLPFFGFTWMLFALAPASGIAAPINSLIYEHWMYLPLLGPALLLAYYGVRLYEWIGKKSEWQMAKYVFLGFVICYLIFLSVQSARRNILWGDTEAFYRQTLSHVPDNVRVLNNLANLYADRGDPERAENFWTRATKADPTQPAPYHNLGNLARDRGEPEEAERLYLTAISKDERFHYSYRNLVAMYLEQRRFEESAQLLAKLLELQPTDASVYYVFAQLMDFVGEKETAAELLQKGAPFARTAEQVADFEQLLRKLDGN